jgi:hypothetical protein
VKRPATCPSWTNGEFSVYGDTEILGFFRRSESARRWIAYLRTTDTTTRFTVSHKGSVVYVSDPQTAGQALILSDFLS